MRKVPPVESVTYNQGKYGYYGELGQGANAQVRFLQTAVSQDELDRITLIEHIPGSEKWDVRDLFQRDVDKERVTRDILPYLKDESKVKYFNPLTLMLLPLADDGLSVCREVWPVEHTTDAEGGHAYGVYEVKDFFRFRVHAEEPAFSQVEWNDRRVRIVAIDGQHRLSALKRWKNEPGGIAGLAQWSIPVVVLGISKVEENVSTASVLEIVRKTFVYINSYAETVNDAREILLNDESVNCVCVQEVIQHAHANDCRQEKDRDLSAVPLMFFDWRGDTSNLVRVTAPAAIKTIEEIALWFRSYLLGDDGDDSQATALEIEDMVPPLETFGRDKKLSHADAGRVRAQFRQTVFPGINYLMTEFTPYKKYIEECRRVERDALRDSDLAQHAFTKIRFGSSQATEDILGLVSEKYDELVNGFEEIKNKCLPELLAREIGMRAVIAACSFGKPIYDEAHNETSSWYDYAKWFTDAVNKVYTEGWFESFDKLKATKRKLLTHIAFDPAGSIINYKSRDVRDALGPFIAILVFEKGASDVLEDAWEELSDSLQKPLKAGFRKQHRAELHDSYTGTPAEFKAECNKLAGESAVKRLRELRGYVGLGR